MIDPSLIAFGNDAPVRLGREQSRRQLQRVRRRADAPRTAGGTAELTDTDRWAQEPAPVPFNFIHSNVRGTGSSAFESHSSP